MMIKKFPRLVISILEKERNIVFIEFEPNLRVDLEVAREIVSSRLAFTENKEHYMVVDMSNVRQVTAEAKEFMQSLEGGMKNILGAALVANNPVAALIANIFTKTPANFPAKFFTNKQEASTWIFEHSNGSPNKMMRIA
jgi:hypothetical protein